MHGAPNYYKPITVQTVATNASTASVTPNATGNSTFVIRVINSVDSWVSIEAGTPTVSQGNGVFMAAGMAEYFLIAPGSKVAAITDSAAAGVLNVVEMTR